MKVGAEAFFWGLGLKAVGANVCVACLAGVFLGSLLHEGNQTVASCHHSQCEYDFGLGVIAPDCPDEVDVAGNVFILPLDVVLGITVVVGSQVDYDNLRLEAGEIPFVIPEHVTVPAEADFFVVWRHKLNRVYVSVIRPA